MNSNLCASGGVPYTSSFTLFTCILSLFTLSLTLRESMGAPSGGVTSNFNGVNPEIDTNKELNTFYLRTKNNKVLEILNDGTVRGSDCGKNPTKYSLLRSNTHCHTQKFIVMQTIYGLEAKKFLCIHKNGTVYATSAEEFSEDDCGFKVSIQYNVSHNTKYLHNTTLVPYALAKYKHAVHGQPPPSGRGIRKYHLALTCNNIAVSIYRKKDRKRLKNDTLFMEDRISTKLEDHSETCTISQPKKRCKHHQWCPVFFDSKNGRTYVKFCTRVRKNFFSATLRDFRLFRKRNCWEVLKKLEKCKKMKQSRSSMPMEEENQRKQRKRKRRHGHGPTRGKRSDFDSVTFNQFASPCTPVPR